MMAARPCADAALPTPAFASPQPTSPPSVSTFTMTESNDAMRPKSLVCCRSYGIGTWTQVARTLVIFIGAFSYPADEALSRRLGGRPEGCYTTGRSGCRGPRNGRIAHVEGAESRARRSGRRRPRRRAARPRADHAHDVLVGVPPASHHGRRPAGMGERGREGDERPRQVPDAAQASLGAARDVRRGPGGPRGPVVRDRELHARAAHPADARGAARRGRHRARQLRRLLACLLEALPQGRRVQGREAARRVHARPGADVHQEAGEIHRRRARPEDPYGRRHRRASREGAGRLRVREAGAGVLRAPQQRRGRRRLLPAGVDHLLQARYGARAGDALSRRHVLLVLWLLHERGQVEQAAQAGPGGDREDLGRAHRAAGRRLVGRGGPQGHGAAQEVRREDRERRLRVRGRGAQALRAHRRGLDHQGQGQRRGRRQGARGVPRGAEEGRRRQVTGPVGLNVWSRLVEATFPYFDQTVGPFDSLWLPDHVQYDGHKVAEGWTLLTWALARYPDKKAGHEVLCNSFRNPAHTAKMLATAQALSGGRVILGIGAGWNKEEYLAYGWPFPPTPVRIAQLGEAIELIRRMWSDSPASYAVEHYRIADAHCEPPPVPIPPIMVGGHGEKYLLRAVAQHADWGNYGFRGA